MEQYDTLQIYITEVWEVVPYDLLPKRRKYLTNNYGQLLHDAISVADLYNVKWDITKNEQGRMQNAQVYFMVQSDNLSGGTRDTHTKDLSGYLS